MADKRVFPTDQRLRHKGSMLVAVILIFILGVGNFAMHRAVLDSGHPALEQMSGLIRMFGGKLTLVMEFLVLLAAMLMAANGWPELAWGYAAYSGLNAFSAWAMLSGRV